MNLSKILELTIAGRIDITKSIELENMIKQAILEEETTKAGGNSEKNRLKSAQKYIEKAVKDHEHRKDVFGGCTYQNDKQWFVNGFSCVGLNKPITGLPEAEAPMNFNSIIPDYNGNHTDYRTIEYQLDIPTLKTQLKQADAEEKAQGKKSIKRSLSDKRMFQVGDQWFSIALFLETLAIIPGTYTYYQVYEEVKGERYGVRPLIVTNENDDIAMILPVAKDREVVQEQEAV